MNPIMYWFLCCKTSAALKSLNGLKVVILELADQVTGRTRAGEYAGKTVALSLKNVSFAYLSRMKTLPEHTDLAANIYRAAVDLLERHWPEGWPVRTVEVALAELVLKPTEQHTLFREKEKLGRAGRTCDYIRNRFGGKAIFRASSFTGVGVRYAG